MRNIRYLRPVPVFLRHPPLESLRLISDFQITGMVLLAALLHAIWNALVKTSDDNLIAMSMVIGASGLLGAMAIPFVPFPRQESWVLLAFSVLFHLIYQVSLVQAYRRADLSQVYPIFRGIPPVLVALLSGTVAGEWLTAWQTVGVLVISLGVASLALRGRLSGKRERAALAFSLAAALAIAAYTFADGLGVRRAGDPLSYAAWMFSLMSIPYVAIVIGVRKRAYWSYLRVNWRWGIGAGIISTTGFTIVLWAFAQGALAPIAALRETSVIFAALIGTVILGEPFGRQRVAAAVLVAAGMIMLHVTG